MGNWLRMRVNVESSSCISRGRWKNKIEGALSRDGEGMSQQKPPLSSLKAARICPRTRRKPLKKQDNSRIVSQQKWNQTTATLVWTRLYFCSSFFFFFFYIYIASFGCLFVSVVYCVILYSQGLLCLCFDFESGNKGMNRLRTSHSEHRWWVQLCLEIRETHSSTVAEPGTRKSRVNPPSAGPHTWKRTLWHPQWTVT